MQFKLNTELLNIVDLPVVNENGVSLTIKSVIVEALMANNEGDSGQKKDEKYLLAKRIAKDESDLIDLSAEEIVLVKELVGKFYGQLVVGQVYDLFR